MKQVLIVTYFFPPYPTIGSVRLGGLAKYLPEYGWKPVVMTPVLPGTVDTRYHVVQTPYEDRVLKMEKKLNISAKRSEKGLVNSLIFNKQGERRPYVGKLINMAGEVLSYPDGKKAWIPIALKAAGDILRKHPVNAMISSSMPHTTHLIAHKLKKTHGVPWVADFRDLWTNNPYYSYSRIRNLMETRLEQATLTNADALSITSKPWADDLARLHGRERVHVIHNGFDPEDFTKTVPLTERFTITYTGGLYDGKRDPELLFAAMRDLIDQGVIDPGDVEIRFFGWPQGWLETKINRYGLTGIAVQHGVVPREDAIHHQQSSQLLLLLNWDTPRERGTYTGKVYEYFAAKRPILSLGAPKGVLTDLLDCTQTGKYACTKNELKAILTEDYQTFKETGQVPYHGVDREVNAYSHMNMAGKFADILNQITA